MRDGWGDGEIGREVEVTDDTLLKHPSPGFEWFNASGIWDVGNRCFFNVPRFVSRLQSAHFSVSHLAIRVRDFLLSYHALRLEMIREVHHHVQVSQVD